MNPTLHNRRRQMQDVSRFLGLVGSPANLATGFALPANAKLYASCSLAIAAPVAVVTVKGKQVGMRAGLPNVAQPLQYAERDALVKKDAGAPGLITLYILGNLGKLIPIAQG